MQGTTRTRIAAVIDKLVDEAEKRGEKRGEDNALSRWPFLDNKVFSSQQLALGADFVQSLRDEGTAGSLDCFRDAMALKGYKVQHLVLAHDHGMTQVHSFPDDEELKAMSESELSPLDKALLYGDEPEPVAPRILHLDRCIFDGCPGPTCQSVCAKEGCRV